MNDTFVSSDHRSGTTRKNPQPARQSFATFLMALLGLAAGCGAHSDPNGTADDATLALDRPNIVLFLVDDMGWRDLGVYGSSLYETPTIDRFASESVRFTNAYAAGHVCSPTRASLMTGKYPARLRLTDWLPGRREHDFERLLSADKIQALPLEEATLAETLQEHGYRTGIFGKWHLGDEEAGPLHQGFDVQVPQWNGCCPRGGYHPPYEMEGLAVANEEDEYVTDRLTDLALGFIHDHSGEESAQPFFLYLSHFAVHDPIQGREDLVQKYRDTLADLPAPSGQDFVLEGNPDAPSPLSRDELRELATGPSHREHRVLPQRTIQVKQHQDNPEFAAMVESVDESLGRVLDALETTNQLENTIVVFYSDNGGMSAANFGRPDRVVEADQLDAAYSTSNLPLRGAKGWLYEGGVRVPLIVRWPNGGERGTVRHEPVISPDLYPTLLEMAGLSARPDQHVDGMSFAAALKGEDFDRGPIYWHFPHYSNHGMQSPNGAIRLGDFKLLEYFENDTVQLFDLANDPGEREDLARTNPEKAEELRDQLHEWRQSVSAAMPRERP